MTHELQGPPGEPHAYRPVLLAHYMPWFSLQGGVFDHWRRDKPLRPRYTPHIGLYDSCSSSLIEYHLLLMQLAGVDCVIADWYGIEDYPDHAFVQRATDLLFGMIEKTALQFALCYEPINSATTLIRARDQDPTAETYSAYAKRAVEFAAATWFGLDKYLKVDNGPLLLCFGDPDGIPRETLEKLEAVLLRVEPAPTLVTQRIKTAAADGAFSWIPVYKPPEHKGTEQVTTQAEFRGYIDGVRTQLSAGAIELGLATPGFQDCYEECGEHKRLDPQSGNTLRMSLEIACRNRTEYIQVATWNDWEEASAVEPATEGQYGYRYLEILQEFKRTHHPDGFVYEAGDLRLPFRVYQMRLANRGNAALNRELDHVVQQVFLARSHAELDRAQESLVHLQG